MQAEPAKLNTSGRNQDLEELLDRSLGDVQIAARLFTKFCSSLPDYFDGVSAETTTNTLPQLKAGSHKLRGAASTLGFDAMASAARRLEFAAQSDDFEAATLRFLELTEEINGFLSWANSIDDIEAVLAEC